MESKQLINGLSLGSIYALIALGICLIIMFVLPLQLCCLAQVVNKKFVPIINLVKEFDIVVMGEEEVVFILLPAGRSVRLGPANNQ